MNVPIDRTPPGAGPHLSEDRCLDIVAGLASSSALEEALRHARVCPECDERLRRCAADFEALRAREARGEAAPADVPSPPARPSWTWTDPRVWAPLAAAAALVALFFLRPHAPSRPEEAARWIAVDRDLVLTRGDANGADSLFRAGLEAYERHDAAAAARLLAASHATGGEEDLRRLYLASALVTASRPAEALAVLDDLRPASLPEPWRSEGLWVRYLALDRAGRRDEAAAELRELADAPGAIGSMARERMGAR